MEALKRDYERMGLSVSIFPGLLVISGKNPHTSIVCAHLDRHGLISVGGGNYVYAASHIKEIKYGEANKPAITELNSIAKRFIGEPVYAYDPQTGMRLGDGYIEESDAEVIDGEMVFHIHGMPDLPSETPVAYARKARFEDGFLKGQIDNAISLGVIQALFQNGFQGTALLSCEEEIGKSWIPLAEYLKAHKLHSQNLIVLDTSPYTDPEPIEVGRVIFRNRDYSEAFNPSFVSQLKDRAGALELPYQVKDEYLLAQGKTVEQLGSTELGRLLKGANRQWSGATVQIPTMMYHTSNESTSLAAISNYYRFLHDILIEHPLAIADSVAA